MACRLRITTFCWSTSAACAASAGSDPPAGYASITVMRPARCAACSAPNAISASVYSRTARSGCERRSPISKPRAISRLMPSARITLRVDARAGAAGASPGSHDYPPSSLMRWRKLAISCLLWVRCLSSTSRMRVKPCVLSASTSIRPASGPAASQTMSISRSRA